MLSYAITIIISLTIVAPQNILNNNKMYLFEKCVAAQTCLYKIELLIALHLLDLFIQNQTQKLSKNFK